jgi:Tfp pilus assembly protein PilF
MNATWAGGAYCVLGLLNTYLPSIAGGNKPLALREFNQSLAIEPQNPLTLCGLASYYVEIGQKDKALTTLARLEHAQAPIDLEFEMQIMRQEGQKLRKKIH